MIKIAVAKKAIDAVRDGRTIKQIGKLFLLAFICILSPALLFFSFLDSAFAYFSPDDSEYVSRLEQVEAFSESEMSETEMNACSFLYLTFPGYFEEDFESRTNEVIEQIRSGSNAVQILTKMSESYDCIFTDPDIAILESILGGA